MSKTNNNADNDRHETLQKLSNGKLAVTQETSQGSFVVANDAIQPGKILLECPAAGIALDPLYRKSHCGYCANQVEKSPTSCSECEIIAVCTQCKERGASEWHTHSGECQILCSLVDSFCQVFSEFQGMTRRDAAQQVESIYIITMRLVHRRQQSQKQNDAKCPLPSIDWKLLDLLYTSPLPPASDGGLVTAMATLLQTMNHQLHSTQTQPLNPQDCISIWNKCRGCCHAITDLTRPLGAQNLGMALFVPHSFYNHGCAPNAFLSCMLPNVGTGSISNAAQYGNCTVVARAVCCSDDPVRKGEPIVLSYIPLSGLCKRERRMRLKETYHFSCNCRICQDGGSSKTEAWEMEQAVGGEFATGVSNDDELNQILGPLRELQIECHQNLTTASTMDIASHESAEDPRTDCIEQCIAMLRMAQRGIRNNKVPPSHEVSLECHRLLAVAYSLLRAVHEDAVDVEWNHHKAFLSAAARARLLMDPSALAIQHNLAACCRQQKINGREAKDLEEQFRFHCKEAVRAAKLALGQDHPLTNSVQLPGVSGDDDIPVGSKKRRKLVPDPG